MKLLKKAEIIQELKKLLPSNPVIVEAGAFNGRDTILLSKTWPDATIHAFEPVPEIFALLKDATVSISNIRCYQLALSNQNGTAQLHVSQNPQAPEKPFPAASLLKPKERLAWSPAVYPTTITVTTTTLDAWADQHSIAHIDFLWLDLQGMALPVLQASPKILATVKALFIEVEFIEAYENQAMYQDVLAWLETQGFLPYARDFENQTAWFFGNVLLVRQ